jgi:hypothetical protein
VYTQLRERNCTSYLRWAVPPPPLLLLLLACCCRHNKWQRFLERAVGSRRFSCSPKVSLEKKFIWHLEKSKEEFLFTNTVGDRGYIDDQKKTIEITGIYYLCIHISILNCWWWLTLRGVQPFFFLFLICECHVVLHSFFGLSLFCCCLIVLHSCFGGIDKKLVLIHRRKS